jgi:hypothetical protein
VILRVELLVRDGAAAAGVPRDTCAKFVTTPEYAPRLRARLEVEQQLVQDADERGWTRESNATPPSSGG